MLIFLTEFLICRAKQRFPSMLMIILSLEKKSKKKISNNNKTLESKIQSIVMTFGLFSFLVSGFFRCLTGFHCKITLNIFFILINPREDTSVSFSALVPPKPDLVRQYFLAARMSPKFPLPLLFIY